MGGGFNFLAYLSQINQERRYTHTSRLKNAL